MSYVNADGSVAVMSLSVADERRRQGESKDSNFVEIFKGTNLVSRDG